MSPRDHHRVGDRFGMLPQPESKLCQLSDPVEQRTVYLDASSSHDVFEANDELQVRWDFDGDGQFDTDWNNDRVLEHDYSGLPAEVQTQQIGLEVKPGGTGRCAGQRTYLWSGITGLAARSRAIRD